MARILIEILAFVVWTVFVAYATWYFTAAKSNAPLSLNEARLLWKIHRRDVRCNAKRWREIKDDGHIVGFECECGYKHVQKRPVVANGPVVPIGLSETLTYFLETISSIVFDHSFFTEPPTFVLPFQVPMRNFHASKAEVEDISRIRCGERII